MLRVYLDQFAWIRLSRARNKLKVDAGWDNAYATARDPQRAGLVSFPLDLYRYWETAKNPVDGSRARLVETMVELSDFDSMCGPTTILDYEIDLALRSLFQRPTSIEEPRIYGRGIGHLSSGGVTNSLRPPDEREPSADSSSDLRIQVDVELEKSLLGAGPESHARAGLPLDTYKFGDMFVRHELTVASKIAALGVRGKDLLAAVVAADFEDIAPAIRLRMDQAGVTPDEVVGLLGDVGLLNMVQSLPTRKVTNSLRVSKHQHAAANQRWMPNDFIDVVQLPVPVVYCPVVMTEARWVDAMQRDKLGERFGTELISKPQELVDVLTTMAL
jgi:hypothetical protein